MNMRVDEENGKAMVMVFGNFSGFQAMSFGRTLVVLFKLVYLVLGGQDYGIRIRGGGGG